MENKKVARKINAETERNFRGSWSGYERDKFFYNPDGAYPQFFDGGYVFDLDFDDDGRAAVPVDIDGDGDQDLALLSLQGLRLMENLSRPRHFARVRLTATRTQALAIGAKLKLKAGGTTQQEYVRIVEGFLSQVSSDLHFGLGDSTRIDSITVTWPSGKVEEWRDLPADSVITLTEGATDAKVSALPRWPEESRPKPMPAFSFDVKAKALDGVERPLALKGKPAVLNFWAPDCAPCKQEMPRLQELAVKFGGEAQFAGISVEQRDLEAVRAIVAGFGLTYPQFVATDDLLRSFYGADGRASIPATFVFDAAGKLRRTFLREVDQQELSALLASFRNEGVFEADLEMRGQESLLQQKFQEAIDWFEKANRVRPGTSMRLLSTGLAYLGLGKAEDAAKAFQEAVQLDPQNAQAQANLGTARFKQGRPQEAIACFQAALAVRGEDVNTLVNLGNAAAVAKQVPLAIEAFDRAAKADPTSVPALTGRGKVALMTGQVGEARRYFERALEVDPAAAEARDLLGKIKR